MKKVLLILMFIAVSNINVFGQKALDTLYFVNGNKEAVLLTGITDKSVQYNYKGENIPISTPKNRLEKVIVSSGRVIVFENTSKKKTVFSAVDWENVEITNVESEVEGLIRIGNVSGKAKGSSGFSSIDKMQNRALTKMRMQAAFLGSDVVYSLGQTTDYKTKSSTISGTSYSVVKVKPINIAYGKYKLKKTYKLGPNDFQLNEVSKGAVAEITIDENSFFNDEDYYALKVDSKKSKSESTMYLLKVDDNELVFLLIDRRKGSKLYYYNMHFSKD